MRPTALRWVVTIVALLSGCAGAHYPIKAERLKYPASFSRFIHDDLGTLKGGQELNPLGDFSFRRTSVGFLYSMTGTTIDLSDDLNREVERMGGEGIVNLCIQAEVCLSSAFFPLTLIPFYPGCGDVTVSGTVVTRTPPSREPPGGTP